MYDCVLLCGVYVVYNRVAVLTEAQQSDIADVLVVRLTSARDSPTRQATLLALERLGQPASNNTLLAILPSVLDQNVKIILCVCVCV